jgi:serine phosphatase RsbU (regulator of sigma subunit)
MGAGLAIPIPSDDDARVADLVRMGPLLTEPDEILDGVTRRLARIFAVPSVAISFIDSDTQHYKAAVGIPEPFATTRVEPRNISICSYVVGNNDMFVVEDLAADERFRDSIAVTDFGLRFYAGAPLRAESGRAIGSLCILDQRPRSISDREREMLALVAEGVMSHVTLQVASQQLFAYTTRIEDELRRAVKVQRFLLPPACIERPGWTVRHVYRPVAHLGGDFIDVVSRSDGRLAILVADVAGHGTDAALMSAIIKTAFARAVDRSGCATDILGVMNRELIGAAPPGRFVTAAVGILDELSGAVEVACAGHPPPIIVKPSLAEPIVIENNIPLALDPDGRFDRRTNIALDEGDRLVLYTDGAFEVGLTDGKADQLGIEGLARLVGEAASPGGAELLPGVLDHIHGFAGGRLRDDVALLEVLRTATASTRGG